MTCWATRQARQLTRLVGAGRWTSLEHEHLVKLTFCIITDARGGGNSGNGGHSTKVTRHRLLVTLFRKCVETVVLCSGLTLALVLPTRVTTAAAIVFRFFLFEHAHLASRRHRIMRACERRYTSPSSPSSPRSGFKQPLALMNGCLHCLSE